ncbi:MAG: histidine phosphatase family protein [Dehalococcoidia bacterium]|nr:MAG: histidine phosphatase family protein [Dehalococcoidia bacterium]
MTEPIDQLTLHFVRHGETAGNAERRFQWPDTPLSDQGLAQAAAVAETLLATTSATALLSSDYRRTMQTAGAIGARTGLAVVEEPALRERNFGIARGQLYADIGEDLLKLWKEPHFRIEQGESWADVYDRVGGFLAGLRASPPARELILVTHGGAMSVALRLLAGTPIDSFEVMALENCAVRTVTVPVELAGAMGGGK